MLAVPWLHFSANSYLWKQIPFSCTVHYSGLLYFLLHLTSNFTSSALDFPWTFQHIFSYFTTLHRIAVIGAFHLLYPSISPLIHEIPLQILLIFFFIVFHFSSGNYYHMLALLQFFFSQVVSSFGHCYNQYNWLGLTQYGVSHVNLNWKYSFNLCIFPVSTIS